MNSNQTVIATFNLLVSVLGDRPEKQNPSSLPLGRGQRGVSRYRQEQSVKLEPRLLGRLSSARIKEKRRVVPARDEVEHVRQGAGKRVVGAAADAA
jgi:hypothetical protein